MSAGASLSSEDREFLLVLARRTLENLEPEGSKTPEESLLIDGDVPPALLEPCGVFVTLRKAGKLRGCIGYVGPVAKLYRGTIENVVNAARRDPRFPAVTLDEVKEVNIEISVMSPPRKIGNVEEIEVGRDGLILSRGATRGLLLPQVATENGWDRETFLDQTCRKAGLAKGDWRKAEVTIEIFSANVFSEHD